MTERRCKDYEEFTWCEPPLEPGENGTLHTEYRCNKKTGHQATLCEGNIDFCEIEK